MPNSAVLLQPDWPAPPSVGAAMSVRQGGVSRAPFDSLNLKPPPLSGVAEGPDEDDPAARRENLRRYREALAAEPVYLRQVHGATVVRLTEAAAPGAWCADAAVTTVPGLACTVLVADCLPVLLCDLRGRAVGAAHAGWRGMAAGVLEYTVQALAEAAACPPGELVAWLGPCIGPDAFEVGGDVLQAFGVDPIPGLSMPHFRWTPRPEGLPRWHADLAGLAQDRLKGAGVGRTAASGLCTVSDARRFFSFRRDGGRTGRLAASVWRRG